MRHPGLQNIYRMQEVAKKMSECGSIIQGNFHRIRELEERARELKTEANIANAKLIELLDLQQSLIWAENVTPFGLPAGMTNEKFKEITGHEITT